MIYFDFRPLTIEDEPEPEAELPPSSAQFFVIGADYDGVYADEPQEESETDRYVCLLTDVW